MASTIFDEARDALSAFFPPFFSIRMKVLFAFI